MFNNLLTITYQGNVSELPVSTGIGVTFALILIPFILLFSLIPYIFYGVSLSKLAKRNDLEDKHWWAWIPLLNMVLFAKLVEKDVGDNFARNFAIIYVPTILVTGLLPFIGFVPFALQIFIFHKLSKQYSNKATLNTVVAVISLGILVPFQLFRYRNREKIKQENKG